MPPRLSIYLNLDSLADLRVDSLWHQSDNRSCYQHLLDDGFDGVQLTTDELPLHSIPFAYCGSERVITPAEADSIAVRHATRGDLCLTVHVGSGLEDDDEIFRLVEAVLEASDKRQIPIFIETHRATITQDLWRTVQIVKRFPDVRFNGDFSHYYCGQELVYGAWARKVAFMEPIFSRVGFMHGRVASPGCMQVPVDPDLNSRPTQAHGVVNYLDHFKDLWTRAMLGFLRTAHLGDVLIFAPELLSGAHYYARKFPNSVGQLAEESDRYAQALLLKKIALACFADAERLSLSPIEDYFPLFRSEKDPNEEVL
jgi:hypothetical protein